MATSVLNRRAAMAAIVGLVLLAVAAHAMRRGLIAAFFGDGSAGPPPTLTQPSHDSPQDPLQSSVQPVAYTRVLVLDGLGHPPPGPMTHVDGLCNRGLALRVDNGFPTVSLPVQHALWTGRTQQQSGVLYRIPALPSPPPDALPSRIEGSWAVAESHPAIVHSLGFERTQPQLDRPEDDAPGSAWRTEGFAAAATAAIASDSALVLVHVLRIDEAGHAHGADSPRYAAAVASADAQVGDFIQAKPPGPDTRWIVVSDHGHRGGGGHGGAGDAIRIVRGCIVGGQAPSVGPGRALHLVDLHHVLAASVGLTPGPDARGRPLSAALANPDPAATLPRPGALRWVVAGVVLLLAAVGSGVAGAGRRGGLWVLVSYGAVVVVLGAPTLSNPMVYPPWGRDVALVGAVGAVGALIATVRSLSRDGGSVGRAVAGQMGLITGLTLAALVLCGGLGAALGLPSEPPLMPRWTAHASVALVLLQLGAVASALGLSWALLRRG